MKMNFLEWIIERDELEEAYATSQRTGHPPANPQQGDIVISNASGFIDSLITRKTGQLKNDGKSRLSSGSVSKATVGGFSRNGHPVIRWTSFDTPDRAVNPQELLDVTPAFDNGGDLLDPEKLKTRQGVFVWNKPRKQGSHKRVEELWTKWWQQAARPQAAETPDEKQAQAVKAHVFDDKEGLKQDQRKLGDEHKHQQAQEVTQMIQGLLSGNPVGVSYNDLLQIMKGMVEDPYEVQWLRKNGYDNIIDTLHDTGLSGNVAGEEHGRTTAQLEPVNPERTSWDKFYNDPTQITTNPTIAPQSTPEDRMRDLLKTASYDPSIMSHTRHWKRHNDIKRYDYYCE